MNIFLESALLFHARKKYLNGDNFITITPTILTVKFQHAVIFAIFIEQTSENIYIGGWH